MFILLILTSYYACQVEKKEYVCPPCESPCDTLIFDKSGTCPHCKMKLIELSELVVEPVLTLNEVNITEGSGAFLLEGKKGVIKVYYHQPKHFNNHSKILWVIPGAGRNGDSYRDAWVAYAEKYNVLILSPRYAEADYPFEAYHLGNMIKESTIEGAIEFKEGTNIVKLNEALFTYDDNNNPKEWIFNDFDEIFDLVVVATDSEQTQYDIFGHSAGGQILHRLAIFYPTTNANRIIAANSGFYTLPHVETAFPFGIKNRSINTVDLQASFRKKLILLIGALDNGQEKGGTLLRSKTVDQQGLHRLARGRYFYKASKEVAEAAKIDFNWTLNIVPNVGHNHREMSIAAAKILYGGEE